MPVKPRHALRRCVGCGRCREQDAMMRIACKGGREPVFSDAPLAPGRGAYLCRQTSCVQRALQKRTLERALRFQGSLPVKIVRKIKDTMMEPAQ